MVHILAPYLSITITLATTSCPQCSEDSLLNQSSRPVQVGSTSLLPGHQSHHGFWPFSTLTPTQVGSEHIALRWSQHYGNLAPTLQCAVLLAGLSAFKKVVQRKCWPESLSQLGKRWVGKVRLGLLGGCGQIRAECIQLVMPWASVLRGCSWA
jgi:hypothetical protein